MAIEHDELICGIALYAWDLCPGCKAEGYDAVKQRYDDADRSRYLDKHPEHRKDEKEQPARI